MGNFQLEKGGLNIGEGSIAASLPLAYALELHRAIELKAYLRAENDGFRCSPLDYWLAAENEEQSFP